MAPTLTRTTIPELLDQLIARGNSQSGIGRAIGSSASAVSAWRNGLRTPDPRECRALARFLRVPEEVVFRAAGHLSDEPMAEPEVPPWLAAVILELTEPEQETLAETARSLLELRERRAAYEARLAALPTESSPPQSPQEKPSTE